MVCFSSDSLDQVTRLKLSYDSDTCYLTFHRMSELVEPTDTIIYQKMLFDRLPEDSSRCIPARRPKTDGDEKQERKPAASDISAIVQELQEIKVFRNVHIRSHGYIVFDLMVHHPKKQTKKVPALLHPYTNFNAITSRAVECLGLAKDPHSGPSMMYPPGWQVTLSWHVAGSGLVNTSTFVVCDDNYLWVSDVVVGLRQ